MHLTNARQRAAPGADVILKQDEHFFEADALPLVVMLAGGLIDWHNDGNWDGNMEPIIMIPFAAKCNPRSLM